MLEQEIIALREAVEKLTAQLQAQAIAPAETLAPETPKSPAPNTEEPKPEADVPISERDVQDLALRVSREKGAAVVKEILEPYGKRISLIDAKHFADIKAAFDKALG
jgi:ribosomal protein L7/L12